MAKKVVPLPTPKQDGALNPAMLGAFVRARRTQSRLTIHETAALCGVTVKMLSALETATADVGLSKALHICQQLGVPLRVDSWDSLP
jgi:transcriptional regulator with XRE-family HTH domain